MNCLMYYLQSEVKHKNVTSVILNIKEVCHARDSMQMITYTNVCTAFTENPKGKVSYREG